MSYLLKALNKAEQERQRQSESPTGDAPVVIKASHLPKWLLVMIVLVLLLTIIKMFMPDSENLEPGESQVLNPEQQEVSLIEENKKTAGDAETLIQSQAKTHNQSPEIKRELNKVYQLAQLPKNILDQIPTLSLESHIYSSAALYRSVVINGQSFKEGMLIGANVLLAQITSTGIVIAVAGYEVALDKGVSWVAAKNVK